MHVLKLRSSMPFTRQISAVLKRLTREASLERRFFQVRWADGGQYTEMILDVLSERLLSYFSGTLLSLVRFLVLIPRLAARCLSMFSSVSTEAILPLNLRNSPFLFCVALRVLCLRENPQFQCSLVPNTSSSLQYHTIIFLLYIKEIIPYCSIFLTFPSIHVLIHFFLPK